MESNCVNCGAPDARQYDLTVRNTSHDEVPLCEQCHAAITEELTAE